MRLPMPALALLGTVVIPPSAYVLFATSSMSTGAFVVALLYSVVFLASDAKVDRSTQRIDLCIVVWFAALIAITLVGLNSVLANSRFDVSRFWMSLVVFVVVTFGAFSLARLASRVREEAADRAIKFVFYILLISGLASALGFPIFRLEDGKPVSFFMEPSHFALSFLPFLLYMAVRASPKAKPLFLSAGIAVALGLVNLTLIVGVALIALLTMRKRQIIAVAGLGVAAAFMLHGDHFDELSTYFAYYSVRLDISASSENLSVLAFLQGWERAYLNLIESNGLGVGFQQFGIVGSTGDIQTAIIAVSGDVSNLLDGGTVGSKLVGEFGVLGVLILVAYLMAFVSQARFVRALSRNGAHDSKSLFCTSCFVMYIIDLFVRGSGYFGPSAFLMFSSLAWFALGSKPSTVIAELAFIVTLWKSRARNR